MPLSRAWKYPPARRSLVWVAAALVAIAGAWMLMSMTDARAVASESDVRAVASKTILFRETGRLRKTHKNGASFTERGPATGTYEGVLTLYVTTTPDGVTFRMKGETPRGDLRGYGSARIESRGKIGDVSGRAAITGGSGRFSDAHGTGFKVTGTFNRETYFLVVTLVGELHY